MITWDIFLHGQLPFPPQQLVELLHSTLVTRSAFSISSSILISLTCEQDPEILVVLRFVWKDLIWRQKSTFFWQGTMVSDLEVLILNPAASHSGVACPAIHALMKAAELLHLHDVGIHMRSAVNIIIWILFTLKHVIHNLQAVRGVGAIWDFWREIQTRWKNPDQSSHKSTSLPLACTFTNEVASVQTEFEMTHMDTARTSGITKFYFASWVRQSGPAPQWLLNGQLEMYAIVSDFSTGVESRTVDWQSAISNPENISGTVQIRIE